MKGQITVIIPVAGSGSRFSTEKKKQYYRINNKTIIEYTVDAFEKNKHIDNIIIVTDTENLEKMKKTFTGYKKDINVTAGGKTRADSVYKGFSKINEKKGIVLIHDGVRPFVSQEIINSCIESARKNGTGVAAVKEIDTVKKAENNIVIETLDRNLLWNIQTPQGFTYEILENAFKLRKRYTNVTDEAFLAEKAGYKVHLVEGSRDNIKITSMEDILFAEYILFRKENK